MIDFMYDKLSKIDRNVSVFDDSVSTIILLALIIVHGKTLEHFYCFFT